MERGLLNACLNSVGSGKLFRAGINIKGLLNACLNSVGSYKLFRAGINFKGLLNARLNSTGSAFNNRLGNIAITIR